MAITRAEKEAVVSQLTEELGKIKIAVLTDYRGLTVAEAEELRAKLREAGVNYKVTKNTLLKLALQQAPAYKKMDLTVFKGPMALALSFDDEVAAPKVIFQFAKQHQALEIVGAITPDGELLSAADVKALAVLPTREQLLGQVVGTIAAPLTGLMSVMSGNLRGIVNVLNAISKLEKE